MTAIAEVSESGIIQNSGRWKTPVLIGTATLGQVRYEWHNALMHSVIPMNMSSSTVVQPYHFISPMRYHVAEAQNLICKAALEGPYEWLVLLEDDVLVPPDWLLRFSKWIDDGRFPMVSGWYNLKSAPPRPMFFRGRGNGAVFDRPEDVVGDVINEELGLRAVLCDGVPTGCLLISVKLLRLVAEKSAPLVVQAALQAGGRASFEIPGIFRTTRDAGIDPETGGYWKKLGTSDLEFCDRVLDGGWLASAGFDHAATLEWPFPVDVDLRCGHIDLTTGRIF